MSNELEAKFVAILGATGTGKTTELKREIGTLPAQIKCRSFIWSPKEAKDNYAALFPGSVICRTAAEVFAVLRKAGDKGSFHIVFVPPLIRSRDMVLFDIVCKMVLAAGNLLFVVDELHSVTTPSHAPDGWAKLNFMGRAYAVQVFGLSQRPASVDKAFMGSLSRIHVGRLPYPEDQIACAKILNVRPEEVAALTGYQAIQRNMLTGEVVRVGFNVTPESVAQPAKRKAATARKTSAKGKTTRKTSAKGKTTRRKKPAS